MANRVQSLAKRIFTWAVDRGILDASPIERLKPPVKERSRDRVLANPELGAIWRASDALGWPWAPIFKLLVLTAARKSEVAGLRWAEVDPERRLWVKPAARTKAGRVHELPLADPALAIIESLHRIENAAGSCSRPGAAAATPSAWPRRRSGSIAWPACPAGAGTTCEDLRPAAWPGWAPRRTSSARSWTTARRA